MVSFASASTTSNVIDVEALSEQPSHPDNWSMISYEEDVDQDVTPHGISRSSLIREALTNADAISKGYRPSRWRVVEPNDVTSDVIGFGSQWNSIGVFAAGSIHLPRGKDHEAARERAAEEHSFDIRCRVFQEAGIPEHSLRHAGPTTLPAHHGAS